MQGGSYLGCNVMVLQPNQVGSWSWPGGFAHYYYVGSSTYPTMLCQFEAMKVGFLIICKVSYTRPRVWFKKAGHQILAEAINIISKNNL